MPRSKENKRKLIAENVEMVRDLKRKPCKDCGMCWHPDVMEYDHLDATTKHLCISDMVYSGYTARAIRAEIAKCELVCSNCHRLRTMLRREGLYET